MSEMCTMTKVNYGTVFMIFLFLVIFSLFRHKLFTKMENFTNKKIRKNRKNNNKKEEAPEEASEEEKKEINTECPDIGDSIILIVKNVLQGKIFPSKHDTKENLYKKVKVIKQYCRYERVTILSKYYLLVLKDKLSLF